MAFALVVMVAFPTLIKALTHARNEFATACTHVIDARMDDAEFTRIVRGN